MIFSQIIDHYPTYSNGERLFIVITKLIENMELNVLEKAKLSNAVVGEGNYNPDDIEAEQVFMEILLLANDNKVTDLIRLLKELPKVKDESKRTRYFIDEMEITQTEFFSLGDGKKSRPSGKIKILNAPICENWDARYITMDKANFEKAPPHFTKLLPTDMEVPKEILLHWYRMFIDMRDVRGRIKDYERGDYEKWLS